MGIASLFAYTLNNELRLFSPLISRPSAIFIQPKWKNLQNNLFQEYALNIKQFFEINYFYHIPIHESETSGSGDPFVLVPIPKTIDSFDLAELLKKR